MTRLPRLHSLLHWLVAATFATPVGAQHGAGHSHAAAHHPKASAAAVALHDLMESLWHAQPGAARTARACAMTTEIKQRVKAAATRPIPENAAILNSAQALETACTAKNDAGASQEIDRLHQLFYKIAE